MATSQNTASCATCGANLTDGSGDGINGHWQNCTSPYRRLRAPLAEVNRIQAAVEPAQVPAPVADALAKVSIAQQVPGETASTYYDQEVNALRELAEAVRSHWPVPVHCTYCGAEVEYSDTDFWETGGDTADARRYCTDAPDHLHVGEATTCDECGKRLVAGEGDARSCGPCTERAGITS